MTDSATLQQKEQGELPRQEIGESLTRLALYRFLKNKLALISFFFIIFLILVAIFADFLAPMHYAEADFFANFEKPGERFPWGADFMGRDVLSRVIYGTRISLAVGIVGALTSFCMGVSVGTISGYLGGRADNWIMRVVDVLYSIPFLVIVIIIMVYFRAGRAEDFEGIKKAFYEVDTAMGGVLFVFIGLGLVSWLGMARLARGEVLGLKQREFVESAVSQGLGHRWILRKYILPNSLGTCIVAETMEIPMFILAEAFLSFIGLGVNAPTPSWGAMISDGLQSLRPHPHLVLFPTMAMTLTVLAFNFFGDGLRDAFDPKLKD